MINLDYAIYQKMINLGYAIYRKIDKRSGPKVSGCTRVPILYSLKHVVWRFRIYNYFREIFKFCENMRKNRFSGIC